MMHWDRFFRIVKLAWKFRKHEHKCIQFLSAACSAYHGVPYTAISGEFHGEKGLVIKGTCRAVTVSDFNRWKSEGLV